MLCRYQGAFLALAFTMVAVFAGCGSDDPTSTQEVHYEAEGLVLVDSGSVSLGISRGTLIPLETMRATLKLRLAN